MVDALTPPLVENLTSRFVPKGLAQKSIEWKIDFLVCVQINFFMPWTIC